MSKERDEFFKTFLDFYFFKDWEKELNEEVKYRTGISLTVSAVCNTKCSYCYYKNYGNELYPNSLSPPKKVVENSKMLMDWLVNNRYKVNHFDIFSGEFFNLKYYRDILENIKGYFLEMEISGSITIPTNCTFLLNNAKTKEIEDIIKDFENNGIRIYLSLSVDGKYLDNNTRTIKNGMLYDDEFYQKVFEFSRKYEFGFHPMVSSEGIAKWKENYIWFIDNLLDKFGDIDSISGLLYLLEVRNPDWKVEDLKYLEEFILFFIDNLFQMFGRDKNIFIDKLLKGYDFNFLNSYFSNIGRGIGCSEQMDFEVRLGDLAIIPCHRVSYEGFNGGYFKVEDNKVVDIISENPESYIMYKTFDAKNSPSCVSCPISEVCSMYCMGANMEINKDFYVPVETVCRMEFVKAISITKSLMGIGVLDDIILKLGESSSLEFRKKVFQIEFLRDMIEKESLKNGIYRS